MAYPQAVTAEYRSSRQVLQDIIDARGLLIHPPRILVGNGEAFPENKLMSLRSLQNLGTNAVYWLVAPTGTDVDIGLGNFHGVLAPGDAEDDGKGGIVDLSRFVGRISIASSTGTHRVATFEASRGNPAP